MGEMRIPIAGVSVSPLRIIQDERGAVMHMLRVDSPGFVGFGEAYFSIVKPGAVKAWKRHREMIQNLAIPVGSIRLVVYDDRPESPTRGIVGDLVTGAGIDRYELVRLPPMVWYGFTGTGEVASVIANCASLPHDPSEVERLPSDCDEIPYKWSQV